MADIDVKFGAQIGELKAALDQATAATKQFATQVKDHVEGLTAPFKKLQELMIGIGTIAAGGAAFKAVVDSTLETTGAVTKLQKAFGTNLEESNKLAAQLKLLGIGTDEYTSMAIRLDRQIRANNQSLQQMGFTARDLDLGQKGIMDKAIAKVLEYKEGVDRNIAAQVLFGKNVAEVYPLLRTAIAGVSERAAELHEKLQLTVTAEDKARAREYKISMSELSMAFEGIKKAIGDAVLPYLSKFAQWFTNQAPGLISGMKESVKTFITFIFDLAKGFVDFSATVASGLYNLFVIAQYVAVKLGMTTQAEALASIDKAESALKKVEELKDRLLRGLDEVRTGVLSGGPAPTAGGQGLPKGTKSADNLINNKDALAAQTEYFQTAIKLRDEYYATNVQRINTDFALHRISESQKTAQLKAQIDAREREELNTLDAELRMGGISAAQRQKIEDQKTLIVQKAARDRAKIEEEEAKKTQQAIDAAASHIASTFSSELRGILQGTESFAEGMRKAFAKLIEDIIANLAKVVIELGIVTAAAAVMNAVAPGSGAAVANILSAAFSGKLPSFDTGAWSVPGDMIAKVHSGEMIVPATAAQQLRTVLSGSAGGGSSSSYQFGNINVTNSGGRLDPRQVAEAVREAMRSGHLSAAMA